MRKQLAVLFGLVFVSAAAASGQERAAAPAASPQAPARAEVLLLGVYHMASPGRDIFNAKADDVLAPKRQAELAQLAEVLKKFRPTKVAVEADPWSDRYRKAYADYLAGKHELTRNEIEQVGFRVARELGHQAIYPVDADGEYPYTRLVNYAKGSGRAKELEAIMGEIGARVKAQDEYLASHTILETLVYMNADERVAQDQAFDYRMARLGETGDWAGADLVSDWFRRNMRIYGNVVRLADSPAERVLLIYGAGHLGWLRHNFSSDPNLRLRKLAEFVE